MTREDILAMFFCSLIVITILLLGLVGILANIEDDMEIIAQYGINNEVEK